MPNTALKITSEELRSFSPLNQLSEHDAGELLGTSITSNLSAGTPIFQPTDRNKQVFYLLEGEVELIDDSKQSHFIRSGTPEAKQPLGHHIENQYMAIAKVDSVLLSFDADMLELFLSWTTPDGVTVTEIANTKGEWLDRLLQSRGLLRFSEQNIHELLKKMSEVHVNAGDVVIHQDDEDEFYYVIKKGRASVSRKPGPRAKEIKLAELREGDAFGEEALLSDTPRSATVTMEEPGDLMRLSKKDFSELLAEPLLFSMSWEDAQGLVKLGAVVLDVRLPDEYERKHIPGSINIPVALLRLKIDQLSHHRKYIICCDDGSRSSVAAFLLNRHGYDAYILDGGISDYNQPEPESDMKEPTDEEDYTSYHGMKLEKANPLQDQQKADKERVFVSYADHWGDTVSETIKDESINDEKDVELIGKTTQAVPQKFRPVSKPISKIASQQVTQQAAAALKPKKPKSHTLRNTVISVVVIGAALVALSQFNSTSTPKAPTTGTVTESSVTASPAPTTSAGKGAPAVVPPIFYETVEAPPVVVDGVSGQPETTQTTQPDEGSTDTQVIIIDPPVEIETQEPKEAFDPATRGFRDVQ